MIPYHIHIQTKNTSALKMYQLLKDLNVNNRTFFLALYDVSLADIDPLDPTLSTDMKMRIYAEVSNNFWYFIREIVKLSVPGGQIPFQFNRANLAMMYCLENNINFYAEIPRQCGKTTTITTHVGYTWSYKSRNSNYGFFSKDLKSVRDNLEDVKRVIRNLPSYLNVLNENRDKSSQETLESAITKNSIAIYGAPTNPHSAGNRGRGARFPTIYYDEAPHYKYIKDVLLNSAPAWKTAADTAKANGNPYCRIMTSTPGFLGREDSDYIYYEWLPQCIPFDEKLFYDQSNIDSLKKIVYEQSKNDFVYIRFTYKQLGKTEQWLHEQLRNMGNNIENFSREVLLVWSKRNDDSPFTKEQLDRAYKGVRTPIGSIILQNAYSMRFYKKPNYNKRVVISVDCSGMLNNDYASIVVTDVETFEPIATLRSNARTSYSNTRIFSQAIADVAHMFPNGLVVIEKNNMGIAVIDNIISDFPDLIPRMYSSALELGGKTENMGAFLSFEAKNENLDRDTIVYGFDTTAPRRNQMMSEILGIVINELYDLINDKDIYDELNNIIKKKGRIDHKDGKHDDMLFAWCIGLWVLCYSKILESKYNFEFGIVRPMSVAMTGDDSVKRQSIGASDEALGRIANLAIQTAKISSGEIGAFNPAENDYNPHKKESWDEGNSNPFNMSYSEIGTMIFGEGSSALSPDILGKLAEFETPMMEGVDEAMAGVNEMAKTERDEYMSEQNRILMRNINDAKGKYTKSSTPQQALFETRKKSIKQEVDEYPAINQGRAIDSLIDSFARNGSFG